MDAKQIWLTKLDGQDKLDNSLSKSQSSSMSSLKNASAEAITCIMFAEDFTRKNDDNDSLTVLWLGTSQGSVTNISINVPNSETRKTAPLSFVLGYPILSLKGSIMLISHLDSSGALIPYAYEFWREYPERKNEPQAIYRENIITCGSTSDFTSLNLVEDLTATDDEENVSAKQFLVVCSDHQVRVFSLPSCYCIHELKILEGFLIKANIIEMKENACLVGYISNGNILACSLPSLRVLLDTNFLPITDLSFQLKDKQEITDPILSIWGQQYIVHEDVNPISKTFCVSDKGHGVYLASPTELQKFSLCAEFCLLITDMLGELFVPHEMPEQPKESFLKGLFGGGSKNLDREELFGEQSGKGNRSIAKHIPGATLEQLGSRTLNATSEISRAHQLAMERGEKLNLLEERAERMANQAQDFSSTAHQLMLKYRDKKWYQL